MQSLLQLLPFLNYESAFSQLGEHAVSAIGLRIYIITASGGAFREL